MFQNLQGRHSSLLGHSLYWSSCPPFLPEQFLAASCRLWYLDSFTDEKLESYKRKFRRKKPRWPTWQKKVMAISAQSKLSATSKRKSWSSKPSTTPSTTFQKLKPFGVAFSCLPSNSCCSVRWLELCTSQAFYINAVKSTLVSLPLSYSIWLCCFSISPAQHQCSVK